MKPSLYLLTLFGMTVFGAQVSAQEKCTIASAVPAANATYTEQHVLDVGDIPGHQIRMYELHRVYPNDKPNCEGLRRTESWTKAFSDYIDRNGKTWGYAVSVLDSGEKIFTEFAGTSQTFADPDGSKKSIYTGVTTYTGGTGRYRGVQGLVRETTRFDLDKNTNQQQSDGSYWIPK